MKESTKASLEFKLLKWFRKLFNYTPRIQPYIVEERKIQKIRTVHVASDVEFKVLTPEKIQIIAAQSILKTMLHIKAIKFHWSVTDRGLHQVEAITYVPEEL